MDLSNLKVKEGSTHSSKRVGQGIGSGMGKTSTRGEKGQGARQGRKVPVGFEGGALPLFRRVPKHGFSNYGRVEYITINLNDLEQFEDGAEIDTLWLLQTGFIKNLNKPVKVLSDGTLSKKLNVKVQGYSKKAKQAIEEKGGKAEVETLKQARINKKALIAKLLESEDEVK